MFVPLTPRHSYVYTTDLDHVEPALHDGAHEQRDGEDLEVAEHLGGGGAEEQLRMRGFAFELCEWLFT